MWSAMSFGQIKASNINFYWTYSPCVCIYLQSFMKKWFETCSCAVHDVRNSISAVFAGLIWSLVSSVSSTLIFVWIRSTVFELGDVTLVLHQHYITFTPATATERSLNALTCYFNSYASAYWKPRVWRVNDCQIYRCIFI